MFDNLTDFIKSKYVDAGIIFTAPRG